MFGANLRVLSRKYPSVSELSRRLGINRTQFNRYLSGESFPRPDVLDRICTFFNVDARILLYPVDKVKSGGGVITGDFLDEYLGVGCRNISEDLFPSGFYRFTRRSFVSEDNYVVGLVYVFRRRSETFIRGFEAKEAMSQQGLPVSPKAREFRGYVARQEEGLSMMISRHDAMTASFNYLTRVASFENNYWVGYVTRTVAESVTGTRAVRMVYEHLGRRTHDVLAAARKTGFITEEQLLPYHRRLLRPGEPFR